MSRNWLVVLVLVAVLALGSFARDSEAASTDALVGQFKVATYTLASGQVVGGESGMLVRRFFLKPASEDSVLVGARLSLRAKGTGFVMVDCGAEGRTLTSLIHLKVQDSTDFTPFTRYTLDGHQGDEGTPISGASRYDCEPSLFTWSSDATLAVRNLVLRLYYLDNAVQSRPVPLQ